LYVLPQATVFPLTLDVNSVVKYKLTGQEKILGSTFLSLTQDNIFTLSNKDATLSVPQTISSVSLQTLFSLDSVTVSLAPSEQAQNLTVTIPKITDNYLSANFLPNQVVASSCDRFREGKTGATIDEQHNGA